MLYSLNKVKKKQNIQINKLPLSLNLMKEI